MHGWMVFKLGLRRDELPSELLFLRSVVPGPPQPWMDAQKGLLALNGWWHKEHDRSSPVLDLAR